MWCIPSKGGEGCSFPWKLFFWGVDDLVSCDDMGVQVIVPVGAMFAIGAGEPAGMAIVVSADVGHKIGTSGERTGAQGTEKGSWMLAVGKEMGLHHSAENGLEGAMEAGMVVCRFRGVCADVVLEGLIRTEGARAGRTMEGTIWGDSVAIRHRSRPETMDDCGIEFVAF